MKNLSLCNLTETCDLAYPKIDKKVTLDSSALEVFTDFTNTKPLVIDSNTTAVDAGKLMLKAHVRLKIVVGNNQRFMGVVSLQDLDSQEIMIKISEGRRREELLVVDFMQSKNWMKGIMYDQLSKVSIRKLINALKDSSQQHCMVVDNGGARLRGIISASDMARILHLPIDLGSNSSFSAIYKACRYN